MAATIKDIARLAGVSHTTVSRALNNNPNISARTKDRIIKVAKEYQYTSNISAKSLATNRSNTIGLFFSNTSQRTSPGFFYDMLCGVNDVLQGSFILVTREIGSNTDFEAIERKRFDGILYVSQSDQDDYFIQNVLSKEIPLVVLNRELALGTITNVLPMEKEGAWLATRFLIDNGHRNIAAIQGVIGYRSTQNRTGGYLQAMQEANLLTPDEYQVCGAYTIEGGYLAMKTLLALPLPPSAVFAFNDDMAVGAMRAIVEEGRTVPGDVSIVGFDGNIECDYVTPTLTTINKNSREVSSEGTKQLLKIMRGGVDTKKRIYIKTDLLIKASVRQLTQDL